jgi:hypothetical protein
VLDSAQLRGSTMYEDEDKAEVRVVRISERQFEASPDTYLAMGNYDCEVVVRDDAGNLSMIIGGPHDL